MRGKGKRTEHKPRRVRITPAYAGKSVPLIFLWDNIKDHPRVCGEKRNQICSLSALLGSPPHMRGKDLIQEVAELEVGITPAYAGKSKGALK